MKLLQSNTGAITVKTVFLFLLIGLLVGFLGSLYFDSFNFKEPSSHLPSVPLPSSAPPSFADLADNVSPAVVNISSTKIVRSGSIFEDFYSPFREFFGDEFFNRFLKEQPTERKEKSLGSGFVVAEEGYIITNNHVIEAAEEISIRLVTGKTVGAKIVGVDKKTDLALIKADSWEDLPPPVTFGDSDVLRVGDWVVAIGNPFGLAHTVTAGIVSAKGRVIGAGPYDDFIQTDASINPGNSGGPLFNIRGEVVGINTALFTTSGGNIGIGFAVPINMARTIIDQLKEQGEVTRGWLGVNVQLLTPQLAESFKVDEIKGLLVAHVEPNGPAEDAGIQNGDIIIGLAGAPIHTLQDLPRVLQEVPIGTETDITVIRNGEKNVFSITVQEAPDALSDESPAKEPPLGLRLKTFSPEIAQRWGYSDPEQGVLVEAVEPGSPADKAGLERGDVIAEVDRQPIKNLQEYRDRLSEGSLQKGVLFLVYRNRGQSSLYIAVKDDRQR